MIPDCSDFYQSLLEVVLPLRKMMDSTSNTFNFQEESTPVHFLSMVIDGPGVTSKTFSQPVLTIPQLIQTNFRKIRDSELNINRRNIKEREAPAII